MIKPSISIFGEVTLRVVCDENDPTRLQEITSALSDIYYSSANERIQDETAYLIYHLIKNPCLAKEDLYRLAAINAYLGAHAVSSYRTDSHLVEVFWSLHADQTVTHDGKIQTKNIRSLLKSQVIPGPIMRDLIQRLAANPRNGPHLLAVARDHIAGKMLYEEILAVEWLPERLRRKIEAEIKR